MVHEGDLKGSEARFWKLVEARARPGADQAAIERRLWDLFGEEAAVMFTDLSGFSRQVERFGIAHFLQVIFEQKRLFLPVIEEHDGILIKVEADSLLVVFKRADSALRCAVAMQHATRRHNEGLPPEEHVLLCVGLGFGQILRVGDADVYGREVNAASKLGEDTARAREILVTAAARAAIGESASIGYERLDVTVAGNVEAYRVDYSNC